MIFLHLLRKRTQLKALLLAIFLIKIIVVCLQNRWVFTIIPILQLLRMKSNLLLLLSINSLDIFNNIRG